MAEEYVVKEFVQEQGLIFLDYWDIFRSFKGTSYM